MAKSGKKPQSPRRYKKNKPSKQIGELLNNAPIGPRPNEEKMEENQVKTDCNPVLARQYWYKIKVVVEKSADQAKKYGVWKYIRKVGDLRLLQNEYLLGRDIDEQRKRKERIDKIEAKYEVIRESWMDKESVLEFIKTSSPEKAKRLAEEDLETILYEAEVDGFEFLEYLIKKGNASIRTYLELANEVAGEIQQQLPSFRKVILEDGQSDKIIAAFITVPKFREFVKKYETQALKEIDQAEGRKGYSRPIDLIELSELYQAKEAESKSRKKS